MVTRAELLNAALRYAELGYRVFPCVPGTKAPLTAHGFHDASTDAEQIEGWWSRYPLANVGIATEGLIVIDIDSESNTWPADPERMLELAAAPMALTPRGGSHRIFRQPAGKGWRCTEGRLAPKVDTRADGGYIVAPPSVVEGKAYRWAPGLELDDPPERLPESPAWLTRELDGLAATAAKSAPAAPSANGTPTLASVAAAPGEANTIPLGQRNATLARLGGSMRRVGMSQAEIAAALHQTNQDRCVPPLEPREVERIAASIARYERDEVAVALTENHWEQMFAARPADGGGPPDPGPFPESLLAVPGFIGEVTAYTLATAFLPQPALALGAALALLGTLAGRKVRDEINSRTNVYCLGVCPSGGGKERTRQVNKEILFLAGAEKLVGPKGLASHAGLITAVEQQPAILFQLDEIGRLLRTLAEPGRSPHLYHIATNLMKLFTSAGSVYIGDAYADAKRNKTIHQPHVCLWGTTVPQSLYEGLTAENVTDGFLSRVMILEADADLVPKQRPIVAPVPESIVAAVRWWAEFNPLGNLQSEHPELRELATSPAAQERFDALDSEAEEAQRTLGEPLGTLWTRATEKARKLALLHACSRDARSANIDQADAAWACELSRYLNRRLIHLASQWVAENPFDAKRKRVLRMIVEAGELGLTRSELYCKTRSFTTRERMEVLETLLLCGDVREAKDQPGPTGGAPRVRYVAAAPAEGCS